jgi:hypothetical protein
LISGDKYTAYVGSPYVGNAFGDFNPIEVGETVIVAIPGGMRENGCVIISRYWDQSDVPNALFAGPSGPPSGKDPSPDRWIIMKPGTNIHLRTDQGGAVNLQADGAGNINVIVATGKIFLGGTAGTQPVALADVLTTFLNSLRTWIAGHVHSGVTTGPGSTGIPVPGTPSPLPPVTNFKATKVDAV